MGRLVFSGHESFSCKQFWLKKGFDFVKTEKTFRDDTSVVDLGVGKNMVGSIRFWVKAFGIVDDNDNITQLGEYLFGTEGKDLFLEDINSVWLLHYFIVKNAKASIYNLVFNELQPIREEFNKNQLHKFLENKCSENKSTVYNPNTINRDIGVFLKNYLKPAKKRVEIEESFIGLLHELNLVIKSTREGLEGEKIDWYSVRKDGKDSLSFQIVLFAILDNFEGENTISFNELQIGKNSPGRIFGLNSDGLYSKIKEIEAHYSGIIYSETAGNKTLQINSELNKWEILNDYYN